MELKCSIVVSGRWRICETQFPGTLSTSAITFSTKNGSLMKFAMFMNQRLKLE